ncbi:hypothetical protein [Polyangium fumosum]|uniref:Uncharacterized protein n=1 Tax=Polyangium fumosum TaxID=889272 RepID=A0A4U1J9J1_9BACT|nr:hypothetical protein [Polyangium fumosum]TKD04493.1 hypothetical protein E8A74_23065 [Polyangium fumosum]
MKTTLAHNRNRFFATAFLAAALLYPVFTAQANEGVSAQNLGAVEHGEPLVGHRTAPAPEPMQSGVVKCCHGENGSGNPETCVWLPIGGSCSHYGEEYRRALCPTELSDPSNCRYLE